jgi:hypothetical protein
MNRPNALVALVGLMALLAFAAGALPPTAASPGPAAHVNCCNDPSCPPACCPDCPPDCCPGCCADTAKVKAASFTCPLTGEELPCPDCCPLNRQANPKAYCPPCPWCP